MNQGILLPILVLNLSEKKPTKGVAIPSAIYPDNITEAEVTALSLTTFLTK